MDDDQPEAGLVTVVVGDEREEHAEPVVADTWPVDEICAAAVDVARSALLEEADESLVGEHTGVVADGPMVVTHYFAGMVPGYTGWRWAVTVARAPDAQTVTIDETALLPDGDALLAPAWVPWKRRIQSGDLGAGDVMVTDADDPRLVPGLTDNDLPDPDDELRPPQWELGMGRVRMLSPEGRREAAQRWYREVGPSSAAARATDLRCATCGFLLLIGGPLGQAFGVCANGYSPADGRIVALDFGCGAHSETREAASVGVAETVIDEMGHDDLGPVEPEPASDATEDSQAEQPADTSPDAQSGADAGEPADSTADTPPDAGEPAAEGAGDGEHATMHEPGSEEGT